MAEDDSLRGDAAEESRLVAAARSGDRAAFERLVARHADAVFAVVASHLGTDDAEDAAQEVFIRIHDGLAGFQGEARLATWIYRIATNVALTRGRRRRRRPQPRRLEDALEPRAPVPGPEGDALDLERRRAVRQAIQDLPEEQRAVAVLRGLEGLPFDEVARILGIKRPTAESRMARAKERLRAVLGRWAGP